MEAVLLSAESSAGQRGVRLIMDWERLSTDWFSEVNEASRRCVAVEENRRRPGTQMNHRKNLMRIDKSKLTHRGLFFGRLRNFSKFHSRRKLISTNI